jgi:hypothetical protein
MVSDAQTEGTFSIPLLEQARTALSRLSVIRVVGCLPTTLWRLMASVRCRCVVTFRYDFNMAIQPAAISRLS